MTGRIAPFTDDFAYLNYTRSCALNCPIGDVNYDGVLTQADATLILRFLSGTPYSYFQEYLADFNEDGVVNTADSRELLQVIE